MLSSVKKHIVAGNTSGLLDLLQRNPTLATKHIRWGMPPCKTEPLHFLSDGLFKNLWDHSREGDLAQVLIEAGAPVNGLPTSGETPLHGAASLGCLDVARVLIEHGADLEVTAAYPGIPDGTPLDFAVHFGMTNIVDLLVERGATIISARMAAGAGLLERLEEKLGDTTDENTRYDAFRCAGICDRIETVDFLLQTGLNVNHEIDGGTVLHWAAWEAKPRMVAHLLEIGANPNALDPRYNLTPLGWARHRLKEVGTRWGHKEVIGSLEEWEEK